MEDPFRLPPSTSASMAESLTSTFPNPSFGISSMGLRPSRTDEDKEKILVVMGIYTATRGVGQVIGGFVGTALVDDHAKVDERAYGLNKWTPLIIFVGSGMALACACGVANSVFHRIRRRMKPEIR